MEISTLIILSNTLKMYYHIGRLFLLMLYKMNISTDFTGSRAKAHIKI
jgi:hypothetical protein